MTDELERVCLIEDNVAVLSGCAPVISDGEFTVHVHVVAGMLLVMTRSVVSLLQMISDAGVTAGAGSAE